MYDPNIIITAEIVAAYVGNNSVAASSISKLIKDVYSALHRLGLTKTPAESAHKPQPAVAVSKSVTRNFIICLEDGKKFQSLKRHLRTSHNMTPDEYRAKWDLPNDYPIVAPNYAATRSSLAKASGLGHLGRRSKRRKAP